MSGRAEAGLGVDLREGGAQGGDVAAVAVEEEEAVEAVAGLGTAGHNRPSLRCRAQNWWYCDSVKRISEERFGEAEGSHATPSEIALTYYGYPEAGARVAGGELSPGTAPKGPIYDADDYRRRFPDGRIGSDPSLATAEVGKLLYEAAVEEMSAQYREFLAES